MEKLSVFGSSGFIGSNFVKRYPNNALAVKSGINLPFDSTDILYLRSTTNNYNVFNDLHLDIEVNLNRLIDCLETIDDKSVFNFVSSWFVYGAGYERPENKAHEKSPCDPKGFYSITKRTAEQLTISYCETFNKNYRIMRLCNVIGGDNGANKKKNATEFLIDKILDNEDIEIYDGDNYRNYLHVDDVCDAIKLITEQGKLNEIYNVGAPTSHRLIDLMEYVIEMTNSKSKIKLVATPRFHEIVQTKDFFMDTKKLAGLGFTPKYTVHQALNKIVLQKLATRAIEAMHEYVEFEFNKK